MAKATCSEQACGRDTVARGLCQKHYQRRSKDDTLPPKDAPNPLWHHLSNVDRATKVADCSMCGPGVRIRVYAKGTRRRITFKCSGSVNPKRRARRMEVAYKISTAEYEARFEAQGGRCAICIDAKESLVIDHCHKSGSVRGLLCNHCNTALGFLRDDPHTATAAAEYLQKFRSGMI